MKEQFVTYEIAKSLKELGFDAPCLALYKIDDKSFYLLHQFNTGVAIKVPLWQQAIDWIREKHNIDISLVAMGDKWNEYNLRQVEPFKVLSMPFAYETYYEVREAAILKAIEIIKNKN